MEPLVVHRYGDGSKPTVVLLHGLTEAGTTWPDFVDRWGGSWSIVAPDLRATLARPDRVRALVLEDPARPLPRGAIDPKYVAETEAFVAAVTADPTGESAPRGVRNPLLRTVVIPDSGHCVRRDQPDRYFAAVAEALGDWSGRSRVP